MDTVNPIFLQKFQQTKSLSDLPNGVRHLLNALFDEEIDFFKLTSIITEHPSISARLISLANSVWSAPAMPITTIENACNRLGIAVVRNVSIALSISSPFNPSRCPSFDIERFWTTCILVSEGAGLLLSVLPKNQFSSEIQKTTQTAGIIHNIGLLWLAENMAQETEQALQAVMNDSSLSLNQALNEFSGTDYCEVGFILAQYWDIPEILLTAIRYHQKSNYEDQFWEVSHVVGSAAIMVKTILAGEEDFSQIDFLEKYNIERSNQEDVFNKLVAKLDRTRELAKTLFS